jgi:hypothetical protein
MVNDESRAKAGYWLDGADGIDTAGSEACGKKMRDHV